MKNYTEKIFDSFLVIESQNENFINNESDEENVESIIINNPKKIEEKNDTYNDYRFYPVNTIDNFKFKYKIDILNEENNIEKRSKTRRSDSSDFDKRKTTRFFDKKKKEYILDGERNNNKNNFIIIGGENIIKSPGLFKTECILHDKNNNGFKGEIEVDNNYILSFISDKETNKTLYYNSKYYSFSLLSIKNYNSNTNYFWQINYCIEINLKDNRYFLFKLPPSIYKSFLNILDEYAIPEKNNSFFNYSYWFYENMSKNQKEYIYIENGWNIYNFQKEFKRQKIDFENKFYIIDNFDFSFCQTYPKKIIVPNINSKNIKEDLKICADFRTKKRMPALTYRHFNGVCLYRCSQSRNGFMGKNEKDIILLTKLADKRNLIIYDCRPKLNAWVNKLKGAGYENIINYPDINIQILFCNIPNIHAVRSSFEKMLLNISYNNNEYSVISYLPNTLWYETIILILKSSFQIYNSIHKDKNTVLIHCSDGWDRTAQLSSTSQLLLDKYYRTLEGFIVLIEKDWLSFGHQFRYRNGFYSSLDTPTEITSENQFSPIFIQWLDSVYQIMSQNYTKFEFNLNLLTFIAEEVYNGKYGTFLFNNEYEREKYKAKKNTVSIWSEVLKNKKEFLNPIYNKNNDNEIYINYKKIKLWNEYFYKFEKGESEDLYRSLLNKKCFD